MTKHWTPKDWVFTAILVVLSAIAVWQTAHKAKQDTDASDKQAIMTAIDKVDAKVEMLISDNNLSHQQFASEMGELKGRVESLERFARLSRMQSDKDPKIP